MAKHTDRDSVWSFVMKIAIENAADGQWENAADGQWEITLEFVKLYLRNDAPSDRTIRDVLNTMTDQGWLKKQKPQSHTWQVGDALRDVRFKDYPGNTVGSCHALWGID